MKVRTVPLLLSFEIHLLNLKSQNKEPFVLKTYVLNLT